MRRTVAVIVRASLALLVAFILAAGCSRRDKSAEGASSSLAMVVGEDRAMAPSAPMEQVVTDATGGAVASPAPGTAALGKRMLIRNVSLSLVVADVDSAGARVERLIAARGGFVASSSLEDRGGFPWRHYTLRVPTERLDATTADLRALAVKVSAESQNVQDVTEQAVDVQARLRTLRATEEELLGLLKDARSRNQKAEDVMAIYRELTGIRTQIEQYQGQLESLQDLSALSTIALQLQPDAATGPIQPQGWRPGETVRNSFRQLVGTLRGLGDFLIWAAIVALPIVLGVVVLIALLAGVAKRVMRRREPRD